MNTCVIGEWGIGKIFRAILLAAFIRVLLSIRKRRLMIWFYKTQFSHVYNATQNTFLMLAKRRSFKITNSIVNPLP